MSGSSGRGRILLWIVGAVLVATLLPHAYAATCAGMRGGPGDLDGDGFVQAEDCDDSDSGSWAAPGEVQNLRFEFADTFLWDAPDDPGGSPSSIGYDVFRSGSPILTSVDCFASGVEATSATDPDLPSSGELFHYLVEPRNGCGTGGGLACDCALLCDDSDACTAEVCTDGECFNPVIAPEILAGPYSAATCAGGVANFSVVAQGSGGLSYQWLEDGIPVGTDSSTLMLPAVPAEDDGIQITVQVTDLCSTSTSPPATLTVFADPASCLGGNDGQEAPNGAGAPRANPDLFNPDKLNPDRLADLDTWSQAFDERLKGEVTKPDISPAERVRTDPGPSRVGIPINPKGGSGVHLHSGEFYLVETDLAIPGRGFDFVWTREYRSREERSTAMGVQWVHSYDRRVEIDPADPANMRVHDGSSRVDVYVPGLAGCFESPGFFRELCQQPDQSWVLTFADKHRWTFAPLDGMPAEGRIVESRDRNDNAMTFDYGPLGLLTTITDTLGREIQIGYNASNLITSVTDHTGRVVQYEYYGAADPGGGPDDLKSVTTPAVTGTPTGNDFPQGKTTVYTYTRGFADGRLNHNLLTITDPAGQTHLTNVYAPTDIPSDPRFDRLDRQIQPGGTAGYVYVRQVPSAGNPAVTKTIVNDRAGHVREWFFDDGNRLVMERRYTGLPPEPVLPTDDLFNRPVNRLRPSDPEFFETSYEYNGDSLLTRVLYPNGNEVLLTYDESNRDPRLRGNLQQRTRNPGPLGGDQVQIVETWGYDTDFGTVSLSGLDPSSPSGPPLSPGGNLYGPGHDTFPTSYVDGRGNAYAMTYDLTDGNLETLSEPTVLIGQPAGQQDVVHAWLYDAFGQIVQYTNPSGRIDQRTYHATGPQTGYLHEIIVDAPNLVLTTSFEYDARGNLTSTTDPRGNTTSFVVNELNQVVRIVESAPHSYESDLYYDENDLRFRIDVQNVDETGAIHSDPYLSTLYAYDPLDRLTRTLEEIDEDSCAITETEWHANDRLAVWRKGEAVNGNQPANTIRTEHDERDLPYRVLRADGADQSTTQWDYDGNGNMTTRSAGLEDPGGAHVTTFGYDGYDRPVLMTDAEGNMATSGYDANGNRTSFRVDGEETDGGGGTNIRLYEETCTYDEVDRLVQKDVEFFETSSGTPLGDGLSTTKWTFDADARLSSVEDDNAHGVDMAYDTARRLALTTDARGNTRALTYDAGSNLIAVTDTDVSDLGAAPQPFTTDYEWDALNRMTAIDDPVGNRWEYLYDSRRNRTRRTDPLGNVVRYVYDGMNRLIGTERDLTDTGTGAGTVLDTVVTTRTWDDSSRLTSRTDDNGNTTSYVYDALDRLVGVTHADGTSRSTTYDVHGRPLTRTDANGTLQTMTYDGLDRLTARAVSRATGVLGTTFETYRWDGLSRPRLAQDDDSIVTLAYDSLSNVLNETQQIGGGPIRLVSATHDGVGNRLGLTYPSGRIVTSTYDPLNRVQTVSSNAVLVGTYGYVGRRQETVTTPQAETTFEYDAARRLTRKTHTHGSPTGPVAVADYVFDWDPRYDLTLRANQLPGGETTTHAYDSMHRLRHSNRTQSTSSTDIFYTLDGVGNRVAIIGGPDAGSYTMDAGLPEPADFQLNQYTATPTDSRIYDANGNLISRDGGAGSISLFAYDYRNRLVELSDAAGPLSTYKYDALGRRIEKLEPASGQSTRYYYSGPHVVEERDGAGAPTAAFVVPEVDDEVLVMFEESDLNGNTFLDTYRYHTDHIGSVLALTDATGAVVERYDYGDYGAPTILDGTGTQLPGVQTGNPYLFAGRRYDEETGLYYFRTRYMDSHAGRFTTRDRIGTWGDAANTGNAYTYAASNPATYVDPFGEAIFVKIPPVHGDVVTKGWEPGQYFVADSFSFGVEREMKESGEKGGTEDINIGVGELQECTLSKSMDAASPYLSQAAINGNSCGTAEIDFVEVAGGAGPRPAELLRFNPEGVPVRATSGDDTDDRPTEEVAFYYNKIRFAEADDEPVPTGIEHEDIGGDQIVAPGCVCVMVPVPCPSCPGGWDTVIGCSCSRD